MLLLWRRVLLLWRGGLLLALLMLVGCDNQRAPDEPAPTVRPNIMLIVWDTVRADRLGLYGYERATTPKLDEFAGAARVFDNCVSVANTTAPSHASLFTGLTPAEHGVTNETPHLPASVSTLAELLGAAGYQTYMFSENPHVGVRNGFAAGFDTAEFPWSPKLRRNAMLEILRKVYGGQDVSKFTGKMKVDVWNLVAAGEIAPPRVDQWLAQRDASRPFFIFLNLMEAHAPVTPPRDLRERMLTPAQVAASYEPPDRKHLAIWSYVFGLRPDKPGEIELRSGLYDAAVLELDRLFGRIVAVLESRGVLNDTVIILTSDHGEHLGEHHLIDHQFSAYEPVLRVPLIVRYPARLVPGRDARPVQNIDVFPTLLELAGLPPPIESAAVSLLSPRESRARVGECPSFMEQALRRAKRRYPGFDPAPWRRTLRAYYSEPYKLIEASDGRDELYDLSADPGETRNLSYARPDVARRLHEDLAAFLAGLRPRLAPQSAPTPPLDPAYRRRLEALGYLGGVEDAND